jgi:DNA polymerase V
MIPLTLPTVKHDLTVYRPTDADCVTLRMYDVSIPAGFPSPAADYREEEIDFNHLLRPRPSSTFVIKVDGNSMIEAHIPDQSWLVVDRSIKPASGNIVVAVVNSEFTVKRFIKNSSGIRLMPANPKYNPIVITEDMDFIVWGTVTKIIIDPLKSSV